MKYDVSSHYYLGLYIDELLVFQAHSDYSGFDWVGLIL